MKSIIPILTAFLVLVSVAFSQNGTWKKETIQGDFSCTTGPDTTIAVAATNDGKIYVMNIHPGSTWNLCVTLPNVTGVKSLSFKQTSDCYVYATTNDGRIFKIDYCQCSSTVFNSPPSYSGSINGMSWANSSTAYLCGENGKIFKTGNDGSTWVQQATGVTTYLNDIYAPPGTNNAYAVGDMGTVLKTNNGGTNWTLVPAGTQEWLDEINRTSANPDKFLISGSGGFLTRWDGGTVFNPYNTGTTLGFMGFDGNYWEGSNYKGINVGDNGSYSFIYSNDALSQIANIPAVYDYLLSVATFLWKGGKTTSGTDSLVAIAAGNTGLYRYTEGLLPSGISKASFRQLKICPNPVLDFASVELNDLNDPSEISVYDQFGRQILVLSHPTILRIDFRPFPAGVYFIRAQLNGTVYTGKIFKQ